MTRNIFIFLGTFFVGALIALVTRAALFAPSVEPTGAAAGGGNYAGMVSNPLTPVTPATAATAPKNAQTPGADPHANHATPAVAAPASTAPAASMAAAPAAGGDGPVNTVCAICGMAVDPKLPTLEYQGKKIGFGCKMCPPKFKAEPDRYGPFYLRNEVIKP